MGKRIVATIGLPMEAAIELFKLITQLGEHHPDMTVRIKETHAPALKAASSTEPPVAEAVALSPAEEPAWRASMEAPVPPPAEPVDPHAGRRKVYRVVDPSIEMTGVPGIIKSFLIAVGPQSEQVIEARLARGKKSVESALHLLRTRGCVVSESVPDGGQS